MAKKTIGLVENVKIVGNNTVKACALCDTGANLTSVDIRVAAKAQLGPVIRIMKVKNPSLKGFIKRPVVKAIIEIGRSKFEVDVNLQDRSHMRFPILIGRNVLYKNFVVDVEKNFKLFKKKDHSLELEEREVVKE